MSQHRAAGRTTAAGTLQTFWVATSAVYSPQQITWKHSIECLSTGTSVAINVRERLRIDVLIFVLILRILPAIFQQRALDRHHRKLNEDRILQLPGGQALIDKRHGHINDTIPVAFLAPDARRNAEALALFNHRQLSMPREDTNGVYFKCMSSTACVVDPHSVIYNVHLHIAGLASCSCPDFAKRGGACKHIRAALMVLDSLRAAGAPYPVISLASCESEARLRQAQ